ncbi:Uma2 family endonuclease [Streptomyces acidiscabies]|uniref:Uma2 family endonuclease n=1 Tax=Streptomyces acidiscabies TaxID=42234 RepID=A0AAP6BFL6_9ACTN|nr:Uma2 family endonuclease [Streptomyces acidiscabies]MBP5937411.1 Uma2 family endonuclease [Streptomyces sp. LBUM 1476]MBZ3914518.1 Uma2 family endonuclease [Streptomyces acidiscabies]MDX2963855.1 Uma2 family endonuclease [Streptomyces acidiscabies]MDX3017207.1 Uma2 family endonuclease [Streptomyces acidiscabies]MDX3789158.1 Uma2 family endonuclease [Streptomyces acidiscabies]
MSAASVEQPFDDEPFSLAVIADEIMERHPGYRVEIIGGHLLVTPSPDSGHSRTLTKLMRPFIAAGLDDGDSEVHQGMGLWLPNAAEDYVIPDLVIVDADIDDHLIEKNAYDPVCFRLVLEVTSGNWRDDLKTKVRAYAEAKVPVYVVVDRKHQRLHVLTEPSGDEYGSHRVHAPGETVTLPDSIGAEVTLDVAQIIKYGQPKG